MTPFFSDFFIHPHPATLWQSDTLCSMTTLLTHTVAHSTKPSFMPKINNQSPKKFLSLMLSWAKVLKNGKIQKSIGRGGRCAWSPLLKLVGTLRKCSRNDERLREKSLSNLRLQSVCWKLIKADLFRFIAWILFSKVLFFSNKRTRLQLQIMSFFIRIKIHWLILRYKSSKSKFPFTVSSQLSLQTFL